MGAHGAPLVRRGPSPPTCLLALLLLLSSAVPVVVSDIIQQRDSLLKFKESLKNVEGLRSWTPSSFPCSGEHAHWVHVSCSNGSVKSLGLEGLNLAGQIDVDSLATLPSLIVLNLMHNGFEGPMPDWRKLRSLKSLYISNNQFSGPIPEDAFKDLGSLHTIYMGNNKFTGNIPSSLSTIHLLALSIENNQFTGSIPELYINIKRFNASNNQLDGTIPTNLAKFNASAFSGNKGLCGKPLETDCSSLGHANPDSGSRNARTLKLIIIVISILVAIAAIILIILVCRRSRKAAPEFVLATSTLQKIPSQGHQVESRPSSEIGDKPKKVESRKLSFVREDTERFDLQDLLRASAEVLGSGNFGSSYKAVLSNGKGMVVKKFNQMTNVRRDDFHEHMMRLGRLEHPNLLPLVAYYYRKEEKLLVTDHMQNGSLAGRLHGKHSAQKPALDWPTRLKIVKGVAKGLVYLQKELPCLTIPHGHLKSSNVLLDKDYNPVLMDYALVPVVNPDQVQYLMTAYKSPEYAKHMRVTRKTDVWCLGILILETLTGRLPTNYLVQGAKYDDHIASWINSIVKEESPEVFDKDMGNRENCEGEIRKLLKIGEACCEEDSDKRWDLQEVCNKINEISESDH